MIRRVVLLADESARYVVAGLSQLDRLLRTLEECFAPALATGEAPELVVFWNSPELLERRFTRLPVTHLVNGQAFEPATDGETLLLRSNVVFRRGELARLLRSPDRRASFSILRSADASPDWQTLSLQAGAGTDGSAWFLLDPADLPSIERQLLRATAKPSDGFVSRNLNRPISQRLSRWLAPTGITPNQISFLVLCILAGSAWTLAHGTPQGFVFGMLLFHLASVLDGCDGELARAKFLESRLGARLDTAVDLLGNFLLPLAVAVGLSRQPGLAANLGDSYLLEGFLTSAGIAVGILGMARARPGARSDFNDFGSTTVARLRMTPALGSALQGAARLARRDTFALLFVFPALVGKPEWILHGIAITVALHFPVIAWSLWSNARIGARQRAPDRP